jgi:putative spermidine/putrescine transport system substrate-binding protein
MIRRDFLRTPAAAALAALLLLAAPAALAQRDALNVVSWDGAYVKSQILGFIRPYEDERDLRVNVIEYSGGIDEIRRQVRSWNVHWDVVDLELFDAIRACEEGLLERIDPDLLPPAPDGTPAREDFISVSLMPCGVGNVVGSTVVAYNPQRLSGEPASIADFFDLSAFPGRRGLRRTPQGNLEWALAADGVPRGRIYEVLSTEAGVDRAFDVLNRIKPFIEWWRTGEEAIRLLETGRVAMTSVYSGRVYDAVARGEAIEILWDNQVWFYDVWGIPRHGRRTELARDFIRYATSTQSLAAQANLIPYGPTRASSMPLVDPDIRKRLPTSERHLDVSIELNARWWSENLAHISQRFERWLQRPVMVPKDLPR